MNTDNHINYIEFKAKDLAQIKAFYNACFGWMFTDFGDRYTAFTESGVAGGFEQSDAPIVNAALIVLYHSALTEVMDRITAFGGKITVDLFSFPGGRRFHFTDPAGNELAVWSET